MLEFIYFMVLTGNSSPSYLKVRKESSCHEDKSLLKIHNEFLNKLEIITYDDLIDRAKEAIKTYKSKK